MLQVPGQTVEAVIALSIAFVAAGITRLRQGHDGLAARKPWVVAFAFGLLHGLGFGGALAEVGLPPDAVPVALLFFNGGVETGHILLIALVLAIHQVLRALAHDRRDLARRAPLPVYLIGGVAGYWVIERVYGFCP